MLFYEISSVVFKMSVKENLDKIIERKLYDEIIEGKWIPNERIRIERIMEEYSVSRTPVIQALKGMQERGLVVFTNAGHFHVPSYSAKDLLDIKNLRIFIESMALREIEKNDIDVDYDLLFGICENEKAHSKIGDNILAKRDDIAFHEALVAEAGNSMLSDLHRRLQDRLMIVSYSFVGRPVNKSELEYNYHIRLLELMKKGDFEGAISCLEQHITQAYESIKTCMEDNS